MKEVKGRLAYPSRRICLLALILVFVAVLPASLFAEDYGKGLRQARDLSNAFQYVAKLATPSVVNISSVKLVKPKFHSRGMPYGHGQRDPFSEFFGEDFFERFFQDRHPQGQKQFGGMGTGLIIDQQGHILTNNHVIEGADEIKVRLYDKRTFKAKIIGTDPRTDLAVIKIKADNLIPSRLGDSDRLEIGEWVVAVGNPFGLENTITTGIVSAKGRAISPDSLKYEDYIQTDAAINPGNSGGPLVNLEGQVIGINTAIFTRSGGYMGIGFAIPINLAKSVVDGLVKHGRVVRGWLGVLIQNVTEDLASSFGFEGSKGALVGDVQEDTPAGKAGIREGDIIVGYNGQEVEDVNSLRFAVAATSPGTTVDIKVFRNGSYETLKVKIGELKAESSEPEVEDQSSEDLGLKLQNLSPDEVRRFGLKTDASVMVVAVEPFGLAANAGFQANDLIVSVMGKKIESAVQFFDEIKKHSLKKGIRMVVETKGMKRFVVLRNSD